MARKAARTSRRSARRAAPVQAAPSAASPVAPLGDVADLRYSDLVRVAFDGESIVISNAATGAVRSFSREAEPVLNRFMNWTPMSDLLEQTLTEDAAEDAVDRIVGVVHDLLQLGVLDSRQHDLSGMRLPAPGQGWNAAMRFLLETRTTRDTIYAIPAEFYEALAHKAAICRQPSAFYERVDAPFLALSDPEADRAEKAAPFIDVLMRRRTARRFANRPVSESALSKLLYFSWGMTATVDNPLGDVFIRKTSPSGGSLHPIEVYPIVLNVEGVPKGCYHYSVRRHGLEELSRDDPAPWIVAACGDQEWVAEAGVIFLCTAFLPRTAWKYDYARVARTVVSEIGYTGQTAFLAAGWLGLGAFTTAALRDEIFEDVLGLDPTREPVFSVTGAGHLETDVQDHVRPRNESPLGVEGS